MNILIFNAYYTPEVAASMFLEEDIAHGFAKAGHNVLMYIPVPCRGISDETRKKYNSIREEVLENGNLRIVRYPLMKEGKNVLLRALRYILQNIKQFCLGSKVKGIDAIFCGSTPPTQGLMCALLKKKLEAKYHRKIKFVYNLQDVFPDSLVAAGLTHKESILWKIGRKIEDFVYKNADDIIVISNSFKENLYKKGIDTKKVHVIHNWIDTESVVPIDKVKNSLYEEYGLDRDKFIVIYAGNFGAAQGAEIVIDAAMRLKSEDDIYFVIFGGGNQYENACEKVRELSLQNVTINPLLPQERVSEVYSLGDVAIITCKKGFGMAGMPSKTWSIMACNTPIIASFDLDSELAEIIKEAGVGECVEPESAVLLAEKIYEYYLNGKHLNISAREYVIQNASKIECIQQYCDVLIRGVL